MPASGFGNLQMLQKQIEQKTKEAAKRKTDTEAKVKIAEDLLAKCKTINADLAPIEKALAEVNAAMELKDFEDAVAKAENAINVATSQFSEKIAAILTSADDIVRVLSELGEEPENLKQLIADTRASVEKGDTDATIKMAEQTWDVSQKALHEHYAKAYSRAQQVILKAKEFGENVDDLQKDLRESKAMIESEDYSAAITSVKTTLEAAADILRSRVVADIDSIEDSVMSAEDMGADVVKLKEYMSKARELLESKDFDEAMSYARRAQNETEKSVSGRIHEEIRRVREEARIAKKYGGDIEAVTNLLDESGKSMKDKNVSGANSSLDKAKKALNAIQMKVIIQLISRSKDDFQLAKRLEVDISNAVNLLNDSRSRLQKGQFEEAIHAAEQAENEIGEALGVFRGAQEGITQLQSKIKSVEEFGIELPGELKHFEDARNALANKDFATAASLAKSGMEAVDAYLRDLAQEKISEAEALITISSQLKADVSSAREYLDLANEHFAERNSMEAFRNALESIEYSKDVCKEYIDDTIASLDAFLDECEKSFDIGEYKIGLDEARRLVEESQFLDALEKIGEIKKGVESKGADECKRLIGDAQFKIGELEAAGLDASDLHLMISKADEFYKGGFYDKAVATATEAAKDADAALDDVAKKTLFNLKSALEEAKQESIDTTKWRALFKQAKDMLDAGENSSSYQISSKVLDEVVKFQKGRLAVLSRITKCEELLADAVKNKVDTSIQAKLVESAKIALAALDIDRVNLLLEEAETTIEKSMGMYLAAKMILVLKSSIEFAERERVQTQNAAKALDEAKASMKERKYDKALAAAKRAQGELDAALKSRISDEITETRSLVGDAKNVGVDVSRPEKLLEKAQEELDANEFEISLKSALLARDEIDQIREMSSKSALEIRIAKERVRDAEAIGLEMVEARGTLEQAIDSLNSHKYATAFEFAKRVSTQALETIKGNLDKLFEKLEKRISYAEKDGAETSHAEGFFNEAKKAYESMQFQDSIKLIMQCEQELDRADLQHSIATNALEVAKKRLDDAEGDLLSVTKAKKIYSEAWNALQSKRFDQAITLAIALGDEVERVRHEIEDCRLDLSALEERIARLNRIGLEIPAIEVLRDRAEKALHDAEFKVCRETCIEAEHSITVELGNIINSTLDKLGQSVDLIARFGMPDKEFRDMLMIAQTSTKEGLWDFAFEQTKKVSTKIEEVLYDKLESALNELRSKVSVVQKSGASVRMIEEDLKLSESKMDESDYAGAFKLIVDSEALLSKIENLHKEYLDAKYAAESSAAVGKKFGLPTKEADRLIAAAEIERDKDYASAIKMMRQAADSMKGSMDKFNPDIAVKAKPAELKHEARGTISVELTNRGKALAKDLKLTVAGGNVQVDPTLTMPQLKAGETKKIDIPVTPSQAGSFDVTITITSKRLFDGKDFDFMTKVPVTVGARELTAKAARATEPSKCSSCNGKINPGFDIAVCLKCNSQEHLQCAKRTKKCGNCGAPMELP